jgi:hypothetical protein
MFQQSNDYISRPITTHGKMRRLPHQGARHGTVDHGGASDGVFLLIHLWVLPSSWAILLRRSPSSLSSLWIASWCEWLSVLRMAGASGLRVEDPSGARKGGLNRPWDWARPAGSRRLAQAHLGPARSPLRSRGSSCDYELCPPSTCTILTMSSSRPRWRFSVYEVRSFTLQSSGMFLCNTSVLATIGSDFIKLMNTNKTP